MRTITYLYISVIINVILIIGLLVNLYTYSYPILSTVMCTSETHQYKNTSTFTLERTDNCTVIITNDTENTINVTGNILTVGNEPPQKPGSYAMAPGKTAILTASGTLTIGP